jgi:leucyl aminopeptidase
LPHIVIVGKGIVFDTGGLSLKPPKTMPTMKNDMAGAAVAAAAVAAAAHMKLPVRVTGLLSIAENTPSSGSYRPGDVIRGRGGKSVEIINTDAEGRLVMADALTIASEMKPDAIIDVATLTGSCIVALGSLTAGLWSNDDHLASSILEAAEQTGESMWRMPLSREIRPYLRSDVADIRNTASDPWGGATAAALFLQEFVSRSPWAHLDIAGPAFNEKRTEAGPRGATGYGVTTLVRMLENLSTS